VMPPDWASETFMVGALVPSNLMAASH
jgi:hypothetical protein